MRCRYLCVLDDFNALLPNSDDNYAKIYVWENVYVGLWGVEVNVNGVLKDIAVDVKKSEVIDGIERAYRYACGVLGNFKE